MNDKNPINLVPFYMILGFTGISLIITGCLLGLILSALSIEVNPNILHTFQAIFIISGLADFWLIKYARKKLS